LGKDAREFMQKNILLASLLLTIIFIAPAFAEKSEPALKNFTVHGQTVHVLVPDGWAAMHGFLNVPISMVSEKGLQDQRAVIEIIPYGVKDPNDQLAKIQKDPEEFYAQKEDWLIKNGGESMSYLPYVETKKDGASVYSIGIKYRSPAGDFLDESYFVSSKSKQLYFIKVLTPLDMLGDHATQVSEVINTISTKN